MDAPLLPGYHNPQLIAHGATALVFRAIQTNLNRPVAIKVITIDTGSVPVNAARELATTVALSSQPHIVSIIDTGVTEDDRPYIVMEYCEGGSYAQILRQRGPLPVDEVVEVGTKIGEALHAAHEAGIVHRDVKPSNILRSRFGPALTDFGIARAPDELGSTLTREMMTPHHASPEALLHQAQSGLSDVYSLASTLWTLLVGHPPFVDPKQPHAELHAFRDRVLHDPLPPMPRSDVPAWLVNELRRAMSKLPAQRHASALEFAQDLRRGSLGLAPAATVGRVSVSGGPTKAWPAPEPIPVALPPPPPVQPAAPAAPVHLARQHVLADDVDAGDEGGWLGPDPAPAQRASHPWPAQRTPELSTRRFEDITAPARGRRGGLVAVLIGAALIAMASASLLLLRGQALPAATQPPHPSGPTATRFISAASAGAPRDVRITSDQSTKATIAWSDPSGGKVSFVVSRTAGPNDAVQTYNLPAGTTTYTFDGLNPARNYCFSVFALYSVDNIAKGPDVCTRR